MKKKNKGFTLIELLAVIVITGVLALLVMPKISKMVLETRMKIYIQDAKKMVSQAQYRMGTNDVSIEKPELNECIVFSLNYLAVNDFRTPPNDGEYLKDNSFVVVKNVGGGDYEYAVLLIEKRKDGLYQGVEFVVEDQLNASNATKHVKFFEKRDLRYIDNNSLDEDYINESLAKSGVGTTSWLNSDTKITKRYDSISRNNGSMDDAYAPKYSARLTPKNSGGTGVLEATLTISAIDADNDLSSLKVCTRVTDKEDSKYPSLEKTPELCEGYGSLEYYAKEINFSDYGLNYEDNTTGYVYIAVSDPEGHVVRRMKEYNVHINEGPEIKKMELTKLDIDQYNMPKARLKVEVVDDIDQSKDLEVCFQQDIPAGDNCLGKYYNYDHYFSGGNIYNYQFTDPYGNAYTVPDGSSHTLTMYVRDKENKVSKRTVEYNFYKNLTPNVEIIDFSPDQASKIDGKNSLQFNLVFKVTDDISNPGKIYIKIGDSTPITYQQYINEYLSVSPHPPFTAPGILDGVNKSITLRVWDEYQNQNTGFEQTFTLTNIYKDLPPEVQYFRIVGNEKVCYDKLCLKNGSTEGSYSVRFELKIGDDRFLDEEMLKETMAVCISEKKEDCYYTTENKSNFKKYGSHLTKYTFKPKWDSYYEKVDKKKIYLNVVDKTNISDNALRYEASSGYEYDIYYNKSPQFANSTFSIVAADDIAMDNVVIDATSISVVDDFDDYKLSLCYRSITDGQNLEFNCSVPQKADVFRQQFNGVDQIQLKDSKNKPFSSLKGQVIEAYIVAEDGRGLQTKTANVQYTMFDKANPVVMRVNLASPDSYHSRNMNVVFKVKDIEDTYKICFKEFKGSGTVCKESDYIGDKSTGEPFSGSRGEDGDYVEYIVPFDAVDDFGWDPDYHEENPKKQFIFSVMDSTGLTSGVPVTLKYEYYTACEREPFKNETYEDVPKDENKVISTESCKGRCFTNLKQSNLAGKMVPNPLSITYRRMFTGVDVNATHVTCNREYDVNKDCTDIGCFDNSANDPTNDTIYIGLDVREQEDVRIMETGHKTKIEKFNDDRCEELINNSYTYENETQLFSNVDMRCASYNDPDFEYCRTTAEAYCNKTETDSDADYENCLSERRRLCNWAYTKICGTNGSGGYDPKDTMELVQCNNNDTSIEKRYCRTDDQFYKATGYCETSAPFCASVDNLISYYNGGTVQSSTIQTVADTCTAEEYNSGNCTDNNDTSTGDYDNSCSMESIVNGTCSFNNTSSDEGVNVTSVQNSTNCPDEYKDSSGNCVPDCPNVPVETILEKVMNNQCIVRDRNTVIDTKRKMCAANKCYKKHDCRKSEHEEDEKMTCNGVLYQYTRIPSTSGVLLQRVQDKYFCPEIVIKYPNDYIYDAETGKKYILFNPYDTKDYFNIVGESNG